MITICDRKLLIPGNEKLLGTGNDNGIERRTFRIARYASNELDMSTLTYRIDLEFEEGETNISLLSASYDEDFVYLQWDVVNADLMPGNIKAQVRGSAEDNTVRFYSLPGYFQCADNISASERLPGYASGLEQLEAQVDGLIQKVEEKLENGDFIGPQGPQGERGPQGEQGIQGLQGIQGVQGPQGETGPQGTQGPQGIQGPMGERGEAGPQGPKGEMGEIGPQGIQGPTGPQGDVGPRGVAGPAGVMGPQGPQGEQGPQGDTGPQGPQGIQGPKGDKGDKGDPGESGVMTPISGYINFAVDENGNLYVYHADGDTAPDFYYDSATGNLYYDTDA